MFWADKIAKALSTGKKPQLVDDAKTPSGRVHVGALRGVVIHDLIYRALQEAKVKVRYTFIIDDLDPMDDLPIYLPKEKYEKYMGVPLKNIPAPEGENSYAQHYADEFIRVFNNLGAAPEILWNSKLYGEGKLNQQIKLALDNAAKIQEIYEKISGSRRPKDYIPFQPICENCGKIGTTAATEWDGQYVHYECQEKKVAWANGCGHKGKVSPFGGSGKMPWRVEWPAKWAALGVTIEGEGKDHASKGGSRDTANAIAREIFKYDPPYDIPYEHFLLAGQKMSSSKGVGASAIEVSEILPAEILRFLMVRPRPTQHIDFNPEVEHTIPKLFDDFDIARTSKDPDQQRIWKLSNVSTQSKNYFVPRFSDLINLVQMPQLGYQRPEIGDQLLEKVEELKGSNLTDEDKLALEQRVKYGKIYLARFAPEKIKFDVKEKFPRKAENLSQNQKKLLVKITHILEKPGDPEKFQNEIYQGGKDLGLSSTETFTAIYLSLLGKESGPKAAWLILSLDKDFVKRRFIEAAK
ncbi:MAG: lysine--tRNA ligase [Candidatus Woykebacteria bacterium RBG_16_43_9]|uniref:Lysine--tRNA ligase n=1 Tax=Candidatus Woykebacteria bacterium RBG_16_43_9 TaxID=1802596 RepID=A0A1G1WBB6_9BACT|nr:MAG: lysine--tRNA ligase [Candidatus Woykebacteria bacterium RBG_16_43_9]